MHDGRAGGPYDGTAGASNPGEPGWDQGYPGGGYRDAGVPQGGGWYGPDGAEAPRGGPYQGGPRGGMPQQGGHPGYGGYQGPGGGGYPGSGGGGAPGGYGGQARPAPQGGAPQGGAPYGGPSYAAGPSYAEDETAAFGAEAGATRSATREQDAGREQDAASEQDARQEQRERIPGPRTAARQAARGGGQGGSGGDGPGGPGGHRHGGRRKGKGRRGRTLRWVAIAAAVAVLGTAGGAYGYYQYLSGKIRKGERVSGQTHAIKPKANANGDTPMNILIIGSDGRDSAEDKKLGGAADSSGDRADVIMIAHLSADRSNMSLVSIPRDTRVDIPQCTDPKTHQVYPPKNTIINESLGRGGAGCTLATVQNLTGGLYIDHWLTVDFAGVVKMADVLGGAQVCVQQNVDDHSTPEAPGGSHLHLAAGTQTVKGEQALQWLRTRHAFGSDAMRAKAQHMYLNSLLNNLRHQNVFSNPTRLNTIATAAMSAFRVSSEIATPKKLYDLGMQLKSVPSNRTTMLTMPFIEDPENKNHYVEADAAQTVWSLLRNDIPVDSNGKAKTTTPASTKPTAPAGPTAEAAATIPVTVANGTAGTADGLAVPGRAQAITDKLTAAGFTKAQASQQQAPSPTTTVTYPSSGGAQSKADAVSVGKAVGIPAASVKASTSVQGITLTVGKDWTTGTDYGATLPKAGELPTGSDALSGADDPSKNCMYVYPTYRW